MIKIKDLNFRYRDSGEFALKDINLEIGEGECICLTGISGSGKSTLLMAVNGLIPHYVSGEMSGDVWLDGMNTKEVEISRLAEKAGMVFQNPDTQIFALSVRSEVAFGPENILTPPGEIYERLNRALDAVDMGGFEDRNPNELSYGQKQRITLASVLSLAPRILLMDEPLSLMDCGGKERILDIISELKEKGFTVVIGEHNLPFMLGVSDRILVMHGGEIIRDAVPGQINREDIRLFNEIGIRWGETGVTAEDELTPNFDKKFDRNKIIEIRNLTYTYPCGICALNNLSLDVYEGEFLGILGKNGSGKTTLLKAVVGLIHPGAGEVTTLGISPHPYGLFGKVGFLIQDPEYQIFEETVFDEIAFSLKKLNLTEDEIQKRVNRALEVTNMEDLRESDPLKLSFGQKHRVAFASLLALKPRVIILDDLTKGLDYGNLKQILDTLKIMQRKFNVTVIICTHDHEIIKKYVDRVVRIGK